MLKNNPRPLLSKKAVIDHLTNEPWFTHIVKSEALPNLPTRITFVEVHFEGSDIHSNAYIDGDTFICIDTEGTEHRIETKGVYLSLNGLNLNILGEVPVWHQRKKTGWYQMMQTQKVVTFVNTDVLAKRTRERAKRKAQQNAYEKECARLAELDLQDARDRLSAAFVGKTIQRFHFETGALHEVIVVGVECTDGSVIPMQSIYEPLAGHPTKFVLRASRYRPYDDDVL